MIRLTVVQCCLEGLAQNLATLLTAYVISGLVIIDRYRRLPTADWNWTVLSCLHKFEAGICWRVDWLGILHSKFLQDSLGISFLTDPHFSSLWVLNHLNTQGMVKLSHVLDFETLCKTLLDFCHPLITLSGQHNVMSPPVCWLTPRSLVTSNQCCAHCVGLHQLLMHDATYDAIQNS